MQVKLLRTGALAMRDRQDEDDEWRRLKAQRAELSPIDRLYGEKRTTAAGDEDLRHQRRTGRLVQMSFRMQPRIRSMLVAIVKRDRPPSLVVLFEQMLEAYLKQTGDLDERDIPSDDEMIDKMLKQQDRRDGQ